MEYYPGKEAFEVAGISLDKEDETDLFLANKGYSVEFHRKLHRMRFVETPLLILGPDHLTAEDSDFFETGFHQYKESKELTFLEDLSEEKNLRKEPPCSGFMILKRDW